LSQLGQDITLFTASSTATSCGRK